MHVFPTAFKATSYTGLGGRLRQPCRLASPPNTSARSVSTAAVWFGVVCTLFAEGQYDAGDLVTEITNKLTAAGAPFTDISFAISSNVATFANANANPCTLTFDKSDCTGPSSSLASKFGWKAGFRLNEYEIEGSGGTQSGEAIVTLYLPRYLYFIVDEFSNANPHSFFGLLQNSQVASQQILARMTIPTTFVNGELRILDQNQFMATDVRKYSNEINIQRLHVSIVDEFGNVIDLNGADFSFCLKLTTL